eukprot:TRINITY_DN9837_c0_g1_i1.p1 TRINITY_DN9837_c0_g1~~TRINITY_DN9837_c0_g1_i1.p1  ORF type:complete len:774 (-),score=189.76 TRINITY_DN9837_c0_g1_i1:103-2424(-)
MLSPRQGRDKGEVSSPRQSRNEKGDGVSPKQTQQHRTRNTSNVATLGVYHVPLESLPKSEEVPGLPKLLYQFLEYLATVVDTEGIFRISGSLEEINKLRAALNAGEKIDFMKLNQPHVVAGAFKQFLRDLPTTVLTEDCANLIDTYQNYIIRIYQLKKMVEALPAVRKVALQEIIRLLHTVTLSPTSKMTADNLGRVFGPNLFPSKANTDALCLEYMSKTNQIAMELIESAPVILSQDLGEIIEYQSTAVDSHRKELFTAWLAFLEEEAPPKQFFTIPIKDDSNSSANISGAFNEWLLENTVDIPSVEELFSNINFSSSFRRKKAVALEGQSELITRGIGYKFSEAMLSGNGVKNIIRSVLRDFPSNSFEDKELQLFKHLLCALLPNLTLAEADTVIFALKELSSNILSETMIDSTCFVIHESRNRAPSFYLSVAAIEKEIYTAVRAIKSAADAPTTNEDVSNIELQSLIAESNSLGPWDNLLKLFASVINVLETQYVAEQKVLDRLDNCIFIFRDWTSTITNSLNQLNLSIPEASTSPKIARHLRDSDSNDWRKQQPANVNSPQYKRWNLMKELIECREKEERLRKELAETRKHFEQIRTQINTLNSSTATAVDDFVSLFQGRYAENRHQLSKKQGELVEALVKGLEKFLNTLLSIFDKISSYLHNSANKQHNDLELRHQIQINCILVKCQESASSIPSYIVALEQGGRTLRAEQVTMMRALRTKLRDVETRQAELMSITEERAAGSTMKRPNRRNLTINLTSIPTSLWDGK